VINNFLSEKEVEQLKDAGQRLTENVPADAKSVFSTSHVKQVIRHGRNVYLVFMRETVGIFHEVEYLFVSVQYECECPSITPCGSFRNSKINKNLDKTKTNV